MMSALLACPSLHDLTYVDLERSLVEAGLKAFHARALWRALYRDLVGELEESTEAFLPPLRRWIQATAWQLDRSDVIEEQCSRDGTTRKWLLRLADGQAVETVLMGYPGRHTLCLSTQVGCAMGCVFCATGQMGFVRHLRPGEIVGQALHAQRVLRKAGQAPFRNIVFMGMGEPLHNYEAVMTALAILGDDRGMGLASGRMTVSTVGVVPGILRMAREGRPYNLAVSLHGATDAERGALVPVNRRWPLADVVEACRQYGAETGRRIFFAWTLIAGVNDSPEQAGRLAALLEGLDAHVNLIPLNTTKAYDGITANGGAVFAFQRALQEAGLPCTIRQRRGIDVDAGCGQLRERAS